MNKEVMEYSQKKGKINTQLLKALFFIMMLVAIGSGCGKTESSHSRESQTIQATSSHNINSQTSEISTVVEEEISVIDMLKPPAMPGRTE